MARAFLDVSGDCINCRGRPTNRRANCPRSGPSSRVYALQALSLMIKQLTCIMLAVTLACSKPRAAPDASGDDGSSDGESANHPNIVFILTDDLNVEVYSHMPRLKQLLDNQGTSFHDHFLNISLCCPSRTAILRGQYAHNTQIFSNAPPTGGFETFFANGEEAHALPVWISAAGYRTALIGK